MENQTTICATCGAIIYQGEGKSSCERGEECPVKIEHKEPYLFKTNEKSIEDVDRFEK